MPVLNSIAESAAEMTAWRRHIHQNPEIGLDCEKTATFVAERLRAFGVDELHEGLGRTGLVALIRGREEGPVIGLRADMDALPIVEATGLDYASKTQGKMHACGHDGHTAMLLGAAKYLAETRNFDGTAVVIFQPAEEGGGGGKEMVDDGMMERFGVQEVYGMHNMPGIPLGHFAIRPGAMMAAADQMECTITGKGGHAAKPHDCIDPTLVASHVVVALQSVASRNVDPLKQVVVSVCTFRTESEAFNVIPQTVLLRASIRTMDPEVQDFVEGRIKAIVENTCAAFGATAEIDYRRGYPVTMNAEENTGYAVEAAKRVTENVDADAVPLMGSEDFSFMLNARPGAYIFLGNGDTAMVHHPKYNFDDNAIPFGSSWYAEMVESRMPAA